MRKQWLKSKSKIISILLLAYAVGFLSVPAEATKKKKSHANMFPTTRAATGNKVFIFDPKSLKWAVYDPSGKLIKSGHAVGGKGYCPDVKRACRTPVGTYRVYTKAGPNFRSSKYPLPNGGAIMPWAMFFHRGFAIHGSNDVPNRNASHGCIRVYPSEARWLNQKGLPIGSTVIVRSY